MRCAAVAGPEVTTVRTCLLPTICPSARCAQSAASTASNIRAHHRRDRRVHQSPADVDCRTGRNSTGGQRIDQWAKKLPSQLTVRLFRVTVALTSESGSAEGR